MEWTSTSPSRTLTLPACDKLRVKHLRLKRILDILFSLTLLLVGFPLLLIIIVAIRLTSAGSPIYSQERVGRGGKLFRCYKFRTMYPDADEVLEKLLLSHPNLRREWESKRKLTNDPRITPVGKLLRKTSLDELPQFWNVLRGDLSVVGPRPVTAEEIRLYYGLRAPKVLSVRPGITGIWQTCDRQRITYIERVDMDENYVDRQSIALDALLILKTIPAIVRAKGAC